ncbi:hypothetical protein PENNAL_c0906G02042, partial [Penicillium nalgiovense]
MPLTESSNISIKPATMQLSTEFRSKAITCSLQPNLWNLQAMHHLETIETAKAQRAI